MNSEARKKVCAWLDHHRNDIVDFLGRLIEYKSENPPGNELEAQRDFIKPFFEEEMGWDEVDYFNVYPKKPERPNVNGIWKGTGGGRNLEFNGHIDVVPVTEKMLERWTVDPWKATIKHGMIYGRGSSDMKGGIASMIWAVKGLMDIGIKLRGSLLMGIVSCEEDQRPEFGSVASTSRFQERGYKIPFCINGEPSNLEIHTVSVGSFDFTVKIQGKEAHICERNLTIFPQRYGSPQGSEVGVDAVSKLIRLLLRFEELEQQWNMRWRHKVLGSGGYPIHEDTQGVGCFSIIPSLIEGGTYVASIPGYAKVQAAVSYPSWLEIKEVSNELKKVIEAYASTDDWLTEHPPEFVVPASWHWPPFEVSVDHHGCRTLALAFQEVVEKKALFSGCKANTDCAFIKRDADVDAVTFGPGDLSMGTHGPDEHIPVDQLMNCAKIYACMAMDWCGLA